MALAACVGLAATPHSDAQTFRTNKATVNAWRVGIVSGGVRGTYVQFAADLANVLDDGDKLRVVPMLGKGSVQNIIDILYLQGVDIGIVQSDVLTYISEQGLHRNIKQRIHYIAKLYNEEVHLLGLKRFKSLDDLENARVNVGKRGSGTAMTAGTILNTHGIRFTPTHLDQGTALEQLRRQEIDAMVYVAGKPVDLFANKKGIGGYAHFIPINYGRALSEKAYLPGELTATDYPGLVENDKPVETIAVGAVMAVYNWDPEKPRYKKVERFIQAFFDNFDKFEPPTRHPKWDEVSLEAEVSGWTRFKPAAEWLISSATPSLPEDPNEQLLKKFEEFLRQEGRTDLLEQLKTKETSP